MCTLPPIRFILHGLCIDDIPRIRLLSDPSFNAHYRHHPRELCELQIRNLTDLDLSPTCMRGPNLPRIHDLHGDQLDKYRRPSHSSAGEEDRDLIKGTALPLLPVGARESGREESKNDDDVGRWVQCRFFINHISYRALSE